MAQGMRLVYVGHAVQSCTRSLAFLGESGLMADETTIREELGNWLLILDFAEEQAPEKVGEIDWQVGDHGLARASYYEASTGELVL